MQQANRETRKRAQGTDMSHVRSDEMAMGTYLQQDIDANLYPALHILKPKIHPWARNLKP